MKNTVNISLKKPDGSDVINIDDFNYNADLIDKLISEITNTIKSRVSSSELQLELKKIINNAPSGLNTLKKLAQALNNDSNFSININNKLYNKVDKVEGKQLSTHDYTESEKQKLYAIESGANNYIHPSKHSANIVSQNTTHRFVTDYEKSKWDNKSNKIHKHEIADILIENGKSLGEELKTIPRFNKPNFTFNITVPVNGRKNIVHGLGYQPKLFTFSTTIGNVNPTIQMTKNEIYICNYNNYRNDCYVYGCIW